MCVDIIKLRRTKINKLQENILFYIFLSIFK